MNRAKKPYPLVVTVTSGGVIASLLAAASFLSHGYATQQIEANDASVWVVNSARHLIGHVNTEIGAIATAFDSGNGTDLHLLQSPTTLAVHDRTNNTLQVVDPRTVEESAKVPLPSGGPEVVGAGATTMIYRPETGDTWLAANDDLSGFDGRSTAPKQIGVDAVLSADETGRYAGYSMKSGQLVTGAIDDAAQERQEAVDFAGRVADAQVTLVAGKPVLFNRATNELWVGGRTVALTDHVRDAASVVLQVPSVTGDRVLVAHRDGLLAVALGSGKVTTAGTGMSGNAAAPVRIDDCAYAAWSGGTALRMCGSGDPVRMTISGVAAGARLALNRNGRTVVAADPASGNSWAVQRDGALIANWSSFHEDRDKVKTVESDRDVPPNHENKQRPPVARPDAFGVRPGRANTLPVLLNDDDPNGDALAITDVTDIDNGFGRVEVVNNGQELQLTTTSRASGQVSFRYTIDDGRGGDATATVTVTAFGKDHNSPPVQQRKTRTSVASGHSVSFDALGDWIDPESDPLFLVEASAAAPDVVSSTPAGRVEFTDNSAVAGIKTVHLSVSDGRAVGEGTASITVGAPGTVPIIAESFTITGYTNRQLTVEPLPNVRGGTGKIRLNSATAEAGNKTLKIQADFVGGTFTVLPLKRGTHFIEYSVTDDKQSGSGRVRLEIEDPPDEAGPPVTVPITAFLYQDTTQLVDVLAVDHDPAGGVLSITGVKALPAKLGVIVEIVEQRILRVTLKKALAQPVAVTYTVSNGRAQATGTATIVQIPEPSRLQAPVANPDAVTARVGSAVDIPVLANDRQPNGKPLLLSRTLEQGLGDGEGTLFVSGDRLRYLAPKHPGEYTAMYRVSSTDQQYAIGKVSISVKAVDVANNRPPVPKTLVGRVNAGRSVEISIPLTGIDPDGDAVTLIGQYTAPQLGAVSATGRGVIEYTAGPYSAGTDSFEYQVVDALGQTAQGTIRVGINPPSTIGAPPIAVDDLVTTRPGAQLSVPVTENDSDPAGSELTVVAVESLKKCVAPTTDGRTVRLVAPASAGDCAVLYTIKNALGNQTQAWLVIDVDPNAPLTAPVAKDVQLTLSDIAGRKSVTVDLFRTVQFSEGSRRDLALSIPASFGVSLKGSTATIGIERKARIIPYKVARRDDRSVTGSAFIWVPGTDDARPELRSTAPRLTVASGDTIVIDVNAHVIAAANRPVRIADSRTVTATHAADNHRFYVGATKLSFASAAGYWGPASITFLATDGQNQTPLTLPITVTPKADQPPVVSAATIQLEAGEKRAIDLHALTDYPQRDRMPTLRYRVRSVSSTAVSARIDEHALNLTAVSGAEVGNRAKVVVSVEDDKHEGHSGVITVLIVRSSKPLVAAVPDTVTIRRGETKSVNVLANDEETNPFPEPLRVTSVGKGWTPVPGVRITPSADKRTVTVAIEPDTETGDYHIPYQVADATGDPSRHVTGTLTVRIQDVPDAPAGAPRETARDNDLRTVTLRLPSSRPNNSPITRYVVADADGRTMAECTTPDACTVEGLNYGQAYTFRAYAVNALGRSAASQASSIVVLDKAPTPPGNVKLSPSAADPPGHALQATWSAASPAGGTEVTGYDIRLVGKGIESLTLQAAANETSKLITDPSITPGAQYTVSIQARSATTVSKAATASAVAVGPPGLGSLNVSPAAADVGTIVSWTGANARGGAVLKIEVARAAGTEVSGSACDPATIAPNATGRTSWTDPEAIPDQRYIVRLSNDVFCRMFVSVGTQIRPDVLGGEAVLADGGRGVKNIALRSLKAGPGTIDHWEYSLGSVGGGAGNWTRWADSLIAEPTAYGKHVSVWVRACTATWPESCGEPKQIAADLMPLRTWVTINACVIGEAADITDPENNGLDSTVEVQYLAKASGAKSAVVYKAWTDPDNTIPNPPSGTVTTYLQARVTLEATIYADTPLFTCVNAP